MWWEKVFRVGAQLFYEIAPTIPFELQRFVEGGRRNGGAYFNPLWSRRFEDSDGYRYWLALPANCGTQDGYHVTVQFIPHRCQAAMFISNGGGEFEERKPYYIQVQENGNGGRRRIRHFKFTVDTPVYFVLADRTGRFTVCHCTVIDPLARRSTQRGVYKTITVRMREVHAGQINGENKDELVRQLRMHGLLADPIIQAVRRAKQGVTQPEASITTGSPVV